MNKKNKAKASVAGATAQQSQNGVVGSKNNNNMIKHHSKIIYQPSGKAAEYSSWAANLYNGCSNGCNYCYNNKGITAPVLGGLTVRLKKSLGDEKNAKRIFRDELAKWKKPIIADGGLHFTFVSDPCLPETIDLTWWCIDYAILQRVPVQVLTKRADWLNHPAVKGALKASQLIRVGFSLTGCDELEPGASPNLERIQAMRKLHDAGIATWASFEPIIDPQKSLEMIERSLDCCDHYKIGVLSGKKSYTPDQIRQFVSSVKALNARSVYWKKGLLDFINKQQTK